MNLLQAIRRRRRYLVSRVLGLLGAVWLGMVLQPCLMAAEMGMDDCPHCPMSMPDGCAGASSTDCNYVDRVDYDGRISKVKPGSPLPDHHMGFPAAVSAGFAVNARACATGPPADGAADKPTPPLNVLYCVYLN